jgi:drug/metabolite transporter (DMT)-like permease
MKTTAAFAACSLIWGSTFLLISVGNDVLPPLWAASLRLLLATVVLTALTFVTGQRLPTGRALGAAVQYGFFNMGLSFGLLYWGETVVPSGITAVFYATIPLTTALFAHALGVERLKPLKIGAAIVALGGVAVIFSGEMGRAVAALPLLAIVVAATCASMSGVLLKRGPRQHPLGANAIGTLVGLVVCLVASVVTREPHPVPNTPAAILPVVYLAIMGSVGAFVLYAFLVNHWPVTRISFVSVIVPVVALSLGVMFRHERLTGSGVGGSALVMAGLAVAITVDRRAVATRGHG